ncbi:MAG: hypothetical protein U5J62_00305 [Desulfurivibrio sp.]|nr:hypothetical protein [Desulfurivibrio sp.]
MELRNPVAIGDTLDYLAFGLHNIACRITAIHQEQPESATPLPAAGNPRTPAGYPAAAAAVTGVAVQRANSGNLVRLSFEQPGDFLTHGLFRKRGQGPS